MICKHRHWMQSQIPTRSHLPTQPGIKKNTSQEYNAAIRLNRSLVALLRHQHFQSQKADTNVNACTPYREPGMILEYTFGV